MAKVDQEWRNKLINADSAEPKYMEMIEKVSQIDAENTAEMKRIVRDFGWPTPKMVGKEAAGAAWLLVQHADNDPKFQEDCLKLMEPFLKTKEVSATNYAYLFDRVASNQGRLQTYGTQGQMESGLVWIKPVKDPAKVDQLRKELGMEPLEKYLELLAEAYKCKVDPEWKSKLKSAPKPHNPQ